MKYLLFVSFFFLAGCSTCNFVFDMWGNAKGHCFAREIAMKCDRKDQTFCEQMAGWIKEDNTIRLAKIENLADPKAGPRVWIRETPGENGYIFFNFCPFCGGDWSFKEEFRQPSIYQRLHDPNLEFKK